jgi:hypothetical protein
VNGGWLYQYDFTDAQYESLIKLTATLCRVLPRIKPDYPRDADGRLRTSELTAEEMAAFQRAAGPICTLRAAKWTPGRRSTGSAAHRHAAPAALRIAGGAHR